MKSVLTALKLLVEVLSWIREILREKRAEEVSEALNELRTSTTKKARRDALKRLVDSSK